jgi:hypothetical protein
VVLPASTLLAGSPCPLLTAGLKGSINQNCTVSMLLASKSVVVTRLSMPAQFPSGSCRLPVLVQVRGIVVRTPFRRVVRQIEHRDVAGRAGGLLAVGEDLLLQHLAAVVVAVRTVRQGRLQAVVVEEEGSMTYQDSRARLKPLRRSLMYSPSGTGHRPGLAAGGPGTIGSGCACRWCLRCPRSRRCSWYLRCQWPCCGRGSSRPPPHWRPGCWPPWCP